MKRLSIIFVAIILVLSLGIVPLTVQTAMAEPGDINVPGDHSTIQAAIDAASSGDTVLVAAGTYAPSTNGETFPINMKNGVSLQGAGADVCILDAENTNRVVICNSIGTTTKIAGFTITGGHAANGGGIYNNYSSPEVSNCTFDTNTASNYGGGMYNQFSSSPEVTNCTFSGNSAFLGGGMYNVANSAPEVSNCTFSGNSATYCGGGMRNYGSSPAVTDCTFSGNSAILGGGMTNYQSSSMVTDCTFSGNSSDEGGGMYNYNNSSPTVTNCTFSANWAYDYGGGMYNGWYSSPTVTNCTFSGNTRSRGMYNHWYSSPTVTNCILWGDTGGEIHNTNNSVPVVTYCDIQGGYSGSGNIDTDPLFVDPGAGDFHLQAGSPCIDVGNNSALSLPSTDFEGDPRIWNGVVDMGADEFVSPNEPPMADAGPDQTVEANTTGGANVTLDGSGSSDPDGDPLTYLWTWDGGSDNGVSPTVFLPLGTTTVTLVVNDGTVDSDPDTVDITVEDTTPPEVTADLIPIKIKENEGKCMVEYSATDTCDPEPTVTAVIELPFVPGVDYEYKYKTGVIEVKGPSITLRVTAEDASGNVGTATVTLEFTGKPE